MLLLCLAQFTISQNEDKIQIGIVFHHVQQNDISSQIERRVKQSISNYKPVVIHEILNDTTYQLTEFFELIYDQEKLDFLIIPCYNLDHQVGVNECTFYLYDVKNFVESSYTFSINNSNPKSIVSYLDQKYVKPIFIPSNPWPFRLFTFGSIVGIFYLAQIWIDIDFGGDGSNNSSNGSGSH